MPSSLIRIVLVVASAVLAGMSARAQDTSQGVPATQAGKLPSTGERYKSLQQQIRKTKPSVETAKQKSAALKAEALALRRKLIVTVARVQSLEREKQTLDTQVSQLAAQEKTLSASFAKDRVRVARLLGLLERVQSDYPPAIALQPEDALKASRGAMVLGASLPQLYAAAAALAHRIEALKTTRASLAARRADAARNLAALTDARSDLDQLVARREMEAGAASEAYAGLQTQLDTILKEATDLKSLLDRVASLRSAAQQSGMTVVTAANDQPVRGPGGRATLLRPVNGQIVPGGYEGTAMPGLAFITAPSAAVVAPADSHVLFAGRYHKTGQVLILELPGGYDLVLAGMDRVDVRAGDQLLAGEPVGRMAPRGNGARLYFELRQNGKDISPAPWLGIDLRKAKKS